MKRLIFSTVSVETKEDGTQYEVSFNRIVECSDNEFDNAYARIKETAHNGEITVEDIPDEDTPPSQLDRVEAQATYTAMITDTLLEV